MKHRFSIRLLAWLIALIHLNTGFASTMKMVLAKYPHRYSLVTRVLDGRGVELALQAGFNLIHTITSTPPWYRRNKQHLSHLFPNVHFWYGDSTRMLGDVIANIHEPITILLNARYGNNPLTNEGMMPVLQELELIRQHPVKIHTILIDNISEGLTLTILENANLHHLLEKIREINPNYNFSFEDSTIKNDLLVAYVP
jgi:hypothetical protein